MTNIKEEYQINSDQFRLYNGEGPQRGPYKDTNDIFGNNLWHYWANDNNPINIYNRWKSRLIKIDMSKKNNNLENIYHKIIINNKIDVLDFLNNEYKEPDILNNTKNNENILHYTAWSNNIDLMKKYIKTNHYNINQKNDEGITPLIISIHKNNIDIVNFLLLSGADPNILDSKNKNAMHHAADNGNIDIYELLEDVGGDIEQPDLLKRKPFEILEKYVYKNEEELSHMKNYWLNQYNNRCKIWN